MADHFSVALEYALEKLLYKSIREYQRQVVKNYMSGKDVFFCAPTGSGKSLVFEIAPFMFEKMKKLEKGTVIVVSPLRSLMRSQAEGLQKRNIKAIYLKDAFMSTDIEENFMTLSLADVRKGEISILFASPESLLDHQRNIILELAGDNLIRALFVDEAHCIKKFGKPDIKKKKGAYRPCYGKLGELRSLIGENVPVIALTVTATNETKDIILKDLCMEQCCEVILNPDKRNITYWVVNMDNDDITSNFQWLVNLLLTKKHETPRILIFFRQIKHIAEVYELLETSLGKGAYIDYKEEGPNDDRNRLFEMFHQKTDDDVKNSICSSYHDPNGNIRVVLCFASFSMGLDVKGVDTVIHYGPANDIDDYLQESGRAGRDPSHECHAILLKYKRCLGSQNISVSMKDYVKTAACRRQLLMSKFGSPMNKKEPLHLCCDSCQKSCRCACVCEKDCMCTNLCKAQMPSVWKPYRRIRMQKLTRLQKFQVTVILIKSEENHK